MSEHNQQTTVEQTEAPVSAAAQQEPVASEPLPFSEPEGQGESREGAAPQPPRKTKVLWVRGGVPLLVGGFIEFCLAATDKQFRWGVPLGIVATVVAVWGLLDLLGTFDDDEQAVHARVSLRDVAPSLAATAGMLVLMLVLVGLAVAGRLPVAAGALLIPASFLGLVAAVYRVGARLGAWATDETGLPRPLHRRHGFWVVALGTVLYLPMLGYYSLSDPWETHYGEVAREVLARNDWISTWWAQDGWFWSKPVLNFWTEALSMALFGAGYQPDQMLAAASQGREPWPEWAIRMPVFIFTIVALYLLYKGVAKVFGRRAGLLGAIVLATMPHWFFLAHQTMTDMPFVAAMTSAMGLLLLGLHTDPDKQVRLYELQVGKHAFRLSGYHLVFGAILLAVVPQVLYLLSRNVELLLGDPIGFRVHADEFFSGSAVNCGLPGNQACVRTLPVNKGMQPWLQALLWTGVTGVLLWLNRRERRVSRLFFLAAWLFAAISTMGKGPAGFALPMLCAGAYIFATGRWKKLLDLEFASGLLIILAVAIPWYVAMYVRHGQPFTDRLLFHDMWKRAMVHVHDTNQGDDVSFRYFIWQLGYALFPWTGLVPAGLVWWARRRDDADRGHGDAAVFLVMWFVFSFALFTAMLTKFHHYIFPAVPPAAMLTGIVLDRLIGERKLADVARPGALMKYLIGVGGGTAVAMYGLFRLFPGMLMGFKPENGDPRAAMPLVGIPVLLVGLALIAAAIKVFGARDDEAQESDRVRGFEDVLLGAAAIAAAVVVGLVARDLSSDPPGGPVGQARLLYLFTYNYRRPWPESLEFSGMIAAFGMAATAVMFGLSLRRFRPHAVVIASSLGVLWALWALDVYMVKTAPHWGQRETIMAYYQDRSGPEQPLVAYQMNWKGENFYTSNRIPAFVSSGQKFKDWVLQQRRQGVSTFYFVTEHGRSRSLQNELGREVTSFKTVTDKRLNNKFAIFKANFGPVTESSASSTRDARDD